MTVDAYSNVNGLPGVRTAHADSNLTNLTLAPPIPVISSLFTRTLSSFNSSADVTGDYGSLTPTGSTTLSGFSLGSALFPFSLITFGSGSPAPNTQLVPTALSGLGLSIVLNEQTVTGNGISFERIQVNAVHINFTNFNLGIGTLNGGIYLGAPRPCYRRSPNRPAASRSSWEEWPWCSGGSGWPRGRDGHRLAGRDDGAGEESGEPELVSG